MSLLDQISMSIIKDAERYSDNRFLIALSGGLDSMVMLFIFAQLFDRSQIRALYVNHQLSPNADAWQDFCATLCRSWQIDFVWQKVEIMGRSNLEQQARIARYQAIKQHILPQEVVVTAHHQDDLTETFWLNIKRGCGLQGLNSLKKHSVLYDLKIFRPLLDFSKADLLSIAQARKLSWVEDESNGSSQMDRNFLRNDILPMLKSRWHGFNRSVAKTSRLCGESYDLLNELLARDFHAYYDEHKQRLDTAVFIQNSPNYRKAMMRFFLQYHHIMMPSEKKLLELVQLSLGDRVDAGGIALTDKNEGEVFMHKYRSFLYLISHRTLQEAQVTRLSLGERKRVAQGIWVEWSVAGLQKNGKNIPLAPLASSTPLLLANRVRGKVHPFGKRAREQMKKLYQQHEIEPWRRDEVISVFQDNYWLGFLE